MIDGIDALIAIVAMLVAAICAFSAGAMLQRRRYDGFVFFVAAMGGCIGVALGKLLQ